VEEIMIFEIDRLPPEMIKNKKEYKSVVINQIPEDRWYQIVYIQEVSEYQLVEIFELPDNPDLIGSCYSDLEEAIERVRRMNSNLKRSNGVLFVD